MSHSAALCCGDGHQRHLHFAKLVHGSFHQGNPQFGASAGLQCAANSLVSICWARIKRMGFWSSTDLDDILIYGDDVYKQVAEKIENYRILGVDDLPPFVVIEGHSFSINYTLEKTGEIREGILVEPFNCLLGSCRLFSTGALLFINGLTMAIIFTNLAYYLFDSHSKDNQGKASQHGTSILLKFETLENLENYIYEVYYETHISHLRSTYFQFQFVEIICSENTIRSFYNFIKNKRRKSCSQVIQKEYFSQYWHTNGVNINKERSKQYYSNAEERKDI